MHRHDVSSKVAAVELSRRNYSDELNISIHLASIQVCASLVSERIELGNQ